MVRTLMVLRLMTVRIPKLGHAACPIIRILIILLVIVLLLNIFVLIALQLGTILARLLQVLYESQHGLLEQSRMLRSGHIDGGLRYLCVDDHREFLLHLLHTPLALLLVQQGVDADKRVHLVGLLVDLQVALGLQVNDVAIAGEQAIGGLAIRTVAVIHCEDEGELAENILRLWKKLTLPQGHNHPAHIVVVHEGEGTEIPHLVRHVASHDANALIAVDDSAVDQVAGLVLQRVGIDQTIGDLWRTDDPGAGCQNLPGNSKNFSINFT